jgi:hypothetical protein
VSKAESKEKNQTLELKQGTLGEQFLTSDSYARKKGENYLVHFNFTWKFYKKVCDAF